MDSANGALTHTPPTESYLDPTAWGLPCSQSFLDNLPFAIGIYRRDGLAVAANKQYEELLGLKRSEVIGKYNVLEDPQTEATGGVQRHTRILSGEVVRTPPICYDAGRIGVEVGSQGNAVWLQAVEFPLCNQQGQTDYRAAIFQDVSAQVAQQQAMLAAQAQLSAQQAEIEQQQMTILELSTPVIEVWDGILTVPLVGIIDARRANTIMESLLQAIGHYQAESVILDVTGVSVIDTAVANYLMQVTQACRLLGSAVALVGVSSAVAQTLIHLGLDMSALVTRANLRAGIAWAFERQGLVVSRRSA